MSDTDTLTRPGIGVSEDLNSELDTKDPGDEFAHYVKKAAIANGGVTEALCGKKWVPVKNPGDLPVCAPCKDLMDMLHSMYGDQ